MSTGRLSLIRQDGRSRPPESGVTLLESVNNPYATPVRTTTEGQEGLLSLGWQPPRRR